MIYKAAILANEIEEDHMNWVLACSKKQNELEYKVINLTSSDWYQKVTSEPYHVFLAKPSGFTEPFKNLYDERCLILENELKYLLYPSLKEILIYENKRFLSYWLLANGIPHPQTNVFYNKDEAIEFSHHTDYPVVAKYNIGGSGSGVYFLDNLESLHSYIDKTFSNRGVQRRWGPNLSQGRLIQRGFQYLLHPGKIKVKLNIYQKLQKDIQRNILILQEYIQHDFEWRVVVIGDSYFAHKKIKKRNKASGSLEKYYDNPPIELLNFSREIMERFGFYSQAIDLFETQNKGYLINEMQCIFGQSDPYQMLVDGKPGRYRCSNGVWIFEKGDFNSNESYDLRLSHVLKLLKEMNN